MRKGIHAKKIKGVLDKFDAREAERVLDTLSDDEENGYPTSNKEEELRDRLIKCLEAYERTMRALER